MCLHVTNFIQFTYKSYLTSYQLLIIVSLIVFKHGEDLFFLNLFCFLGGHFLFQQILSNDWEIIKERKKCQSNIKISKKLITESENKR